MSRQSTTWLVVTVAWCVAAGCSRTQGATSPRPAAGAVRVRVAPVLHKDVVYEVKALGSLEAEELVQVTAEVEGAVSEVRFHEGDRVGPSTVLARIDPERYALQAAQAEASWKKAAADVERARQERQRREELAGQELVAAEELNRARQEFDRLEAEADAAKATYDLSLQQRRRAELRPPRAGVIDTRAVETGEYVRVGTSLATLVDTSRLRLRFKVSETDSLRAAPGQSVRFGVAALAGRSFEGRVYHVGEVADPATRQVEVLAWVQNPGVLKPGFFAEVSFVSGVQSDAVVVPAGAIQASEQGFVAYVVEDGRARLRPVELGLRTEEGEVEIRSGLEATEQVVVEGSDRLHDGAAVEVAGDASSAVAAEGSRESAP